MRTTITIGDETDQRLRRLVREQRRSYKDVVNDTLLAGLEQLEVKEASPPYRVDAFDAGLAAGVDRRRFNQLVDEIEERL
jgi:predicted transcriptional regulator